MRGLRDLGGVVDLTVEQRPDGVHTSFRAGPAALGSAVGFVAACVPITLTVEAPSLDELFRITYHADSVDAMAGGVR